MAALSIVRSGFTSGVQGCERGRYLTGQGPGSGKKGAQGAKWKAAVTPRLLQVPGGHPRPRASSMLPPARLPSSRPWPWVLGEVRRVECVRDVCLRDETTPVLTPLKYFNLFTSPRLCFDHSSCSNLPGKIILIHHCSIKRCHPPSSGRIALTCSPASFLSPRSDAAGFGG